MLPGITDNGGRVVLSCYYLTPQEMLARCRKIFGSSVRFDVYSTNARHTSPVDAGVRYHQVQNEFNDFSAYIAACRDLIEAGASDRGGTVYVFLNDTLFTRHPSAALLRLVGRLLPSVRQSETPVLCGKTDTYRILLQTSPFSPGLDSYVSTFLFATNGPGIELLHRLFASNVTRAMMRDAADLRSELLPPKFLAFLRHRLRSDDPKFSWHGNRGAEQVRHKAVCVLLEHLMSARFFEEGFILPVNYSSRLDWLLWGAYRIRGWRGSS